MLKDIPLFSSLDDRTLGYLERVPGKLESSALPADCVERALRIRVGELEEKLEKAYEELRGSSRARDRIVNHLAHELGTSLCIISGVLGRVSKNLESGKTALVTLRFMGSILICR